MNARSKRQIFKSQNRNDTRNEKIKKNEKEIKVAGKVLNQSFAGINHRDTDIHQKSLAKQPLDYVGPFISEIYNNKNTTKNKIKKKSIFTKTSERKIFFAVFDSSQNQPSNHFGYELNQLFNHSIKQQDITFPAYLCNFFFSG